MAFYFFSQDKELKFLAKGSKLANIAEMATKMSTIGLLCLTFQLCIPTATQDLFLTMLRFG